MAYFSKIYSSDLPHRAKAVYMYLKDRSNTDGQCYPAIGTIAKELNLSRRTVERAIQDLVKAGLIKKERTDKEQLKEELREYANMLVEIESRFEQYNETDHQQEKRTAEVKQSL